MAIRSMKDSKVLKWFMPVFLTLLVASFAIYGIEDVFRGFRTQDLVRVGNSSISSETYRQDLMRELSRLSQISRTAVSVEEARQLGIDQAIFDRLVNGAVVEEKATQLGLVISHDAIVAEVMANPAFQDTNGQFNRNRFQNILDQNQLTEDAFLAEEANQRIRQAVTGIVSSRLSTPKVMLEAIARYQSESRDGRYFSFSVSESDVAPPSDADLKAQYEATPAAYTAPEYRSIAIMKVEPVDIASKLVISQDELRAGYERYQKDYFTPEKRTILQLSFPDMAKAEEAKRQLDSGTDFVALAKSLGATEQDITFADRLKTEFLDSQVADAAFALPEGGVSAPVAGDLSIAILKAAKITPAYQKTLDDVRMELGERLKLERAKDELASIHDAVEDARANQTPFEEIAGKAGIPFTLLPAVSAAGLDKAGKPVTITDQQEVLKRAFQSDVGVEDDAIVLPEGYLWYEVREVIPSALRPLEEVREQVKADVVAARLRTLAADKAKEMIAKAGTTTKLETLAVESNAPIKTVQNVKRVDVTAKFDGVATSALFAAPANTLTWALDGDGKSAKIIEVSKVTVPPFSAATAETKTLSENAAEGLAADIQTTFLSAARQTADLEINETLWQTIRGQSSPAP